MFVATKRINNLLKTIIFQTTKSRRTTTPRPFNNPQITPLGVLTKQPRSYDYNLPENLPNRHLYWNRTVQNKQLRKRYNKTRLQKLKINPIHSQGKLITREVPQLSSQLSSVNLIKQSIGRTLVNMYQAITKHPAQYLQNGKDADILKYAMKQVHDRHLTTMNFYKFSTYCQLRYMAKLQPTETILIHFYRHLQAAKYNKNISLSLERFAKLTNYIFSREYPGCTDLLYKKPFKFELFGEGEQRFTTFQDIVPDVFSAQYLKQIKMNIGDKKNQRYLGIISKMPGGSKLIQKINATA